ncbi:hypothetical protein Mapa_012313 [Marchantia paleacea]|nr:hypothetical protein Mapa_012313 [Marchantia paleacea]
MEWAKEKTAAATETVKDATSSVVDSAPVQTATSAAERAYETAADYVPNTTKESTPNMTASIINSQPFASFKPDPANVWKGYLIYLLLAAGCTLPWWTFVLAADYFNFRYPLTHILRLLPLVYYGPWLLVYFMFTAFGRQYTSWARINIGLMISIFTLVVLPVMDGVFIEGDRGTTATFWVTIAAVALAGAGDAVAQGSLLGISSELPERFTHAYVCGASLSVQNHELYIVTLCITFYRYVVY